MAEVLVIIPAYNEEASLGRVVEAVRAEVPKAAVAVVNDGSWDATRTIVDRLGVIALHLPYRVGTGAAEQTGFRYALRAGYDAVVRSDGDGQHRAAEIPRLLEALATADVVIGSRYLEDRGYVNSRLRRIGVTVLAGLVSALCRQRFTDPTSGFRAFNRRAIELCAVSYPAAYPEPEAVVLCVRAGLRVREIPVTMGPRLGGRSSLGRLSTSTFMAKVVLSLLIGMLRRAPRIPTEAA